MIKIYQYYTNDINDQSYHYTADDQMLASSCTKTTTGNVYIINDDDLTVQEQNCGAREIMTKKYGQWLFPYVMRDNLYLIYSYPVMIGYPITKNIYKCYGKLDDLVVKE